MVGSQRKGLGTPSVPAFPQAERAECRGAVHRFALLAVVLTVLTGCTSWKLPKPDVWPLNIDDQPGKPDRVVAVWADTVMYHTGQPPVRGFGGRLMFYEGKKEQPIKVEGNLVIYAFDESNRDPNNARPDRKYVFTAEQMSVHYSKSTIGHSYSFWIPWDEVGGIQREISLVPRFEPKKGSVAVGQLSRVMLPGRSPAPAQGLASEATAATRTGYAGVSGSGVTQVSAILPMPGAPQGLTAPAMNPTLQPVCGDGQEPRPMTTTISIPTSLARRGGMVSAPAGGWPASSSESTAPQRLAPAGAAANPSPPTASPPATSQGSFQPWQNSAAQHSPPQSRFAPPRSRPLGEPLARLARDRGVSQQPPATPPSAPGSLPGSASGSGLPAYPPAAASPTS
jgi:hypothetical protein